MKSYFKLDTNDLENIRKKTAIGGFFRIIEYSGMIGFRRDYMFSIRQVELMDYIAIHELNCQEMGYEFPLHSTKVKINALMANSSNQIFVAIMNEMVVGYIHANNYDTLYAPHMKNNMGIAVNADYKQQGIGKALLQAVETWAMDSGATGVRLVSGSTKKEAHIFYRHCGYTGDKLQLNLCKKII